MLKEGTERERQAGVVGGAPVEKVGLVVRLREQGSDTEGVLSAGGWLERAAQHNPGKLTTRSVLWPRLQSR